MKRPELSPRRQLLLVLAVGAALRLLWLLLCPNEPVSDQTVYHDSATNIANGLGFTYEDGSPLGFWPPGYSYLLGGVFAVFGNAYGVAYAVNFLLGMGLIWLSYRVAEQLYGHRAGLLAGSIAAAYPTFIAYTTVIASENAFNPLVLLVTSLSISAARNKSWLWVGMAGLVLGLAALVRPTAFVLPLVMFVAGWMARVSWLQNGLRTAAAVIVMVLVCVPWGMRNQREFGEFKLSSFNGGAVLWMGNHPGSLGVAENVPPEFAPYPLAERDRRMKDAAVDFIVHNPGQFVKLTLRRLVATLRAETIAIVWNEKGITKRLGESALLPAKGLTSLGYFALMGFLLVTAIRKRPLPPIDHRDVLIFSVVATMSIPFVVVLGQDRYHLPLIAPLAILVAGWSVRPRESGAAEPRKVSSEPS